MLEARVEQPYQATRQGQPLMGALPPGIDTSLIWQYLERASDIRAAGAELNSMAQRQPGLVAKMFPEKKDQYGRTVEEQARDLRMFIAEPLKGLIINPMMGAAAVYNMLTACFNAGLKSSLVGPPIDYKPAYTAIWPLILKRARSRGFHEISSGGTIEFEDPVTVNTAVVFHPNGEPEEVQMVGNRTRVYPRWVRTNAYIMDLMEWANRLIETVAIKIQQLPQELDRKIDTDVIDALDAAVPNGTRYSAHPTHITTNTDGSVSRANFKTTARMVIQHTESGQEHSSPAGVALCDPKAIWNVQDWADKEWTPETVEEFNRNSVIPYDKSVVAGLTVDGYSLAINPLASTTMLVRFVSSAARVGYLVPVTLQGKETIISQPPMTDGSPDWGSLYGENSPPSFEFFVCAFRCIALAIPGYYNISKLNQS